MRRMKRRLGFVLLFAPLLSSWVWPAQAPTLAPAPVTAEVAPGVAYRHLQTRTPTGEPWSIHVLEIRRKSKRIELRAVEAAGSDGDMQRALPTELAAGTEAEGADLLAVVNGDYDLPAPYLGIPDGLTVTSRQLWTTGKPGWPSFAVLDSGEPLIGVPDVTVELQSGRTRWPIAALNKPFGSAWGEGLRLYTRQFRPAVRSEVPFDAFIIGRLSKMPPLRVDSRTRGRVLEVLEAVKEVRIPREGLVVVQRTGSNPPARLVRMALRIGDEVRVRVRVRMGGMKGIRHAIGGFPVLVRDRRRDIGGAPGEYLSRRHPRTAVCYNPEKVLFAVVDGRQPELSVGMTLEELADLMVSLGCAMAMNTDGGGSSVMAAAMPGADGALRPPLRIVNAPSDGQERGRGNAWVVLRRR